jgi:zinc protease
VPTVPSASPDRFAAEITNAVLGGGYSSRLNQEIRIQRGLSYGANSRLDLRPQAGVLRVGVQTKNPSAAEVVSLVGAELDRLAQSPLAAAELEARRATLVGDFSRSLETTSGLAAPAAALAVDGLPMDDLPQRVARLQAVTPAQVQEYAGRTFAAEKRRIAIAGVAGEFAGQLKGPVVTVPQAALDLDAAAPPTGR